MKRVFPLLAVVVVLSLPPAIARAHVSIVSGPGLAGSSQEIAFGVGHGCAGADTLEVRIEIPAGVTSVRPMTSDFGRVSVEKDAAGTITAAIWRKPAEELFDADLAYYKLAVRLKVPNQPFTTLFFPSHQTCRAADGTMTTVDWVGLPTDPLVDGGPAAEPAPALAIVPARFAGWNKFTVGQAVADLGVYFPDALIVWKGSAAYSVNPTTRDLIGATAGVTALEALAAGDEIWVRY
jgi:hypothetical protein